MQRQDAQPLEYACQRVTRVRPSAFIVAGICLGIVAVTISTTIGNSEGAEGYVPYLYPLVLPILGRMFGTRGVPTLVLFIVCAAYWPLVGTVAHWLFAFGSRWRRGKVAA